MDYSLETLKREYIDIVRNNFVIMTTNDSFNEQAANRLIDIFKKMNISLNLWEVNILSQILKMIYFISA